MKRKFNGKRLKEIRNERGMSRSALARLVGCSQEAVESWEREVSAPGYFRLTALCDVLGITLDDLRGASK